MNVFFYEKNGRKKVICFLVVFACILTLQQPMTVNAETTTLESQVIEYYNNIFWLGDDNKSGGIDLGFFENIPTGAILTATSSNPEVADLTIEDKSYQLCNCENTTKYDKDGMELCIEDDCKCGNSCTGCYTQRDATIKLKTFIAGKTTVTIQIESAGSILYSKTLTCNVVKYVNPFKSFKLGKKNFASKFNNKPEHSLGDLPSGNFLSKGKIPIKVKLKKGYKLQKITYTQLGIYKEKKIKNGAKLNFSKKNVWELHIVYKDKKGNTCKASLLFPALY